MNFNEQLDDLIGNIPQLTINEISQNIRDLENKLNKNSFCMPFKLELNKQIIDSIEYSLYFSWENNGNVKRKMNCRLFLICIDNDGNVIKKPLGEYKTHIRIMFQKYLIPFMEKYLEAISKWNNDIKLEQGDLTIQVSNFIKNK